MKEITREQRLAFKGAHGPLGSMATEILADGWRDTLAALMQSEFEREHYQYRLGATGTPGMYCTVCGRQSNWDPRHPFSFEQWQAAADKLLSGES